MAHYMLVYKTFKIQSFPSLDLFLDSGNVFIILNDYCSFSSKTETFHFSSKLKHAHKKLRVTERFVSI